MNGLTKMRIAEICAVGLVLLILSGCPLEETAEPSVVNGGSAPQITNVSTTSSKSIELVFSEPVTVVEIGADAELGESSATTDLNTVAVSFTQETCPGKNYKVSGTVEGDSRGTLDFVVPFIGYNAQIPELQLNEIRSVRNKEKVEYIELYAKTAGNLAGVTVYCASAGRELAYIFPSAEVTAGSFIVLHMRKLDPSYTDDISGPNSGKGSDESSDTAYDFWFDTTEKIIHDTDVILIESSNNGKIIDAILMCEGHKTEWDSDTISAAATAAVEAGCWAPSANVSDTFRTSDENDKNGVTATRTAGRITTTAATTTVAATATDWKICPTGKASAGTENWIAD